MASIFRYIAETLHAPESASELLDDIEEEIISLGDMPKKFALVSDKKLAERGIRLATVKNYLIFYVINEKKQTVSIVSVMYNKRDWSSLL